MTMIWPTEEKVIAVIPAFNEEGLIGNVVRQLNACRLQGLVHEVIVVSDGSTDGTAARARQHGASVVELATNQGKAQAFATGARLCRQNLSTIMLVLDADLGAIVPAQLHNMVAPLVAAKDLQMVIGTVSGDLTGISGQRAIRLPALKPLFAHSRVWTRALLANGYGLEVALNALLRRQAIAETNFATLRQAEGKQLGVRAEVDATNLYLRDRETLTVMMQRLRQKIVQAAPERRRGLRRQALSQIRELEERRYAARHRQPNSPSAAFEG